MSYALDIWRFEYLTTKKWRALGDSVFLSSQVPKFARWHLAKATSSIIMKLNHFIVVCSANWPLIDNEAGGDLIDTDLTD